MNRHEQLLLENKAWAQEMLAEDPLFFERHAKGQSPDFLWIGCSDSRISPNDITQAGAGELFMHRNIANMVLHTDMNLLSVLQYAVEVLKIKHVVVCGHYGCGGVQAAFSRNSHGIIDKWLRHIKDVYRLYKDHIDSAPNDQERVNRLVECNVREQLYNVAKTAIVQKAWKENNAPALHGWVYDMQSGLIKPLLELAPGAALDDDIYRYDDPVSD